MGIPPSLRTPAAKQLIVSFLVHAIESEYRRDQATDLRPVLAKRVFRQVEDWAADRIATRLFRAFVAPKAA